MVDGVRNSGHRFLIWIKSFVNHGVLIFTNWCFFSGFLPLVCELRIVFRLVRCKHSVKCTYGYFLKWWYPQITHFNRVFHYKPSILGYPYFRKHPYIPSTKTITIPSNGKFGKSSTQKRIRKGFWLVPRRVYPGKKTTHHPLDETVKQWNYHARKQPLEESCKLQRDFFLTHISTWVWWNTHFPCNDLQSSNRNHQFFSGCFFGTKNQYDLIFDTVFAMNAKDHKKMHCFCSSEKVISLNTHQKGHSTRPQKR